MSSPSQQQHTPPLASKRSIEILSNGNLTNSGTSGTNPREGNKFSKEDIELLARLEEQNRLIESDVKSLNSLASTSNHSRRSSDTSQISDSLSQMTPENGDSPPSDDLWVVWGHLVNDWTNQYKKRTGYVKDIVRKGIPQHFRGIVWQLLCSAQACPVRDNYSELLRQSSPCEKVIKRDIARTYPEHEFFRDKNGPGQEGLFNVMKAYSVYDSEVGYCQGSAFLVGVLLLQMPEEDAFSVLVRLMQEYRLREMYKPTMAELGLCIYQLEYMVQEMLPELHRHFQSQNYHTSMYASSWFLTLYTSCLPLHLAYRVIDLFLSEGMEIIFRLSVAILMICKEDLLKLDMEGLLKYFQKEMPSKCEIDPDYLVSLALQVKYDQKKMKKLVKEYTTLKTKEHEEMVELRRLRTENRLLRQRIENLEQESAELADRLVQGQVSRAQAAEDNFSIKRELQAFKQHEDELKQELDTAYQKVKELNDLNKINKSLQSEEVQQIIDSLQEELVAVKLREAENNDLMKHLHQRISELEEVNRRLREVPPDDTVAQLQEELIAVKLREAEANLSMKELRQKISDLQVMWLDHMASSHPSNDSSQPNSLESGPNSTNSSSGLNTTPSVTSSPLKMLGNAVKRSTDYSGEINRYKLELMSAKLREAEAVSELKELRQKVMELETQNQVGLNQNRRQADEMGKVRMEIDEVMEKEKELLNQLNAEKRKFTDLDSRFKETKMMNRIKEMEQNQTIAELKHKLAAYEIKKEEMMTVSKLIQSGIEPVDTKELQDRMAELQSEMFRLEIQRSKLNTITMRNGQDEHEDLVMGTGSV